MMCKRMFLKESQEAEILGGGGDGHGRAGSGRK